MHYACFAVGKRVHDNPKVSGCGILPQAAMERQMTIEIESFAADSDNRRRSALASPRR